MVEKTPVEELGTWNCGGLRGHEWIGLPIHRYQSQTRMTSLYQRLVEKEELELWRTQKALSEERALSVQGSLN
jgi:hypothetical protein